MVTPRDPPEHVNSDPNEEDPPAAPSTQAAPPTAPAPTVTVCTAVGVTE